LQARSLSGLLFQPGFGAIQFFSHLPQVGLQHHTVLLALGSRLLRQRQLAAEFSSEVLRAGQFLFKSNAPRVFFTASRFRGIPLFARLGLHRFQFHDLASLVRRHLLKARFELLSLCTLLFQFNSGAFQIFDRLPQAGLQSCTVLLALGSRLLRQRQLAAEFVALLPQAGPFLSNAQRVFFKASRLRGIPLFARPGLHRFRFHDLASLVRRHLLNARSDLLSLCTLMLQGGPTLLQVRSIIKNARSQFLALLLLLFERLTEGGSLGRHGLELLLQLFVGAVQRGIRFLNSGRRLRRYWNSAFCPLLLRTRVGPFCLGRARRAVGRSAPA